MSAGIREAASVILLRRAKPAGFEVFLLRRGNSASFMATAHVFPGGACEPDEDARTAAARELFEEAGVLFAKDATEVVETLEMPSLGTLRKRILGGSPATEVLARAGVVWATGAFVPWAHWITPSIEAKRFSARFFVVELPPGQIATCDEHETTAHVWIRPTDALARAGELVLPPPQVRTLWELARYATIDDVLAAGRERATEPHPIMPRLAPQPDGSKCLMLPWDPEYTTAGEGEAVPLTYQPSWAIGPSRFVMEDRAWKHVGAPGSTTAG